MIDPPYEKGNSIQMGWVYGPQESIHENFNPYYTHVKQPGCLFVRVGTHRAAPPQYLRRKHPHRHVTALVCGAKAPVHKVERHIFGLPRALHPSATRLVTASDRPIRVIWRIWRRQVDTRQAVHRSDAIRYCWKKSS